MNPVCFYMLVAMHLAGGVCADSEEVQRAIEKSTKELTDSSYLCAHTMPEA